LPMLRRLYSCLHTPGKTTKPPQLCLQLLKKISVARQRNRVLEQWNPGVFGFEDITASFRPSTVLICAL
jgi:hypothetical protein